MQHAAQDEEKDKLQCQRLFTAVHAQQKTLLSAQTETRKVRDEVTARATRTYILNNSDVRIRCWQSTCSWI